MRLGLMLFVGVCAVALVVVSSAFAAAPAPDLAIHAQAIPSHFSHADSAACEAALAEQVRPCDEYRVTVSSAGSRPAAGPIVLSDELPAGLRVLAVEFFLAKSQLVSLEAEPPEGKPTGTCKIAGQLVTCTEGGELLPDQRLELVIVVAVEEGAAVAPSTVAVSEAGVPRASLSEDDVIDSEPALFGASALVSQIAGLDGATDTHAGDHPYEQVTRIDLNTKIALNPEAVFEQTTVGDGARDVVVDLPAGFIGSATATPKCTFAQLQSLVGCPSDTMVGHLATEPGPPTSTDVNLPIYSLVPERGAAAEFGFVDALQTTHVIYANLAPTPAGYVLRATAREVIGIDLWDVISTFYGNPAAKQEELERRFGAPVSPISPAAMFTNPSDCSGEPLTTKVFVDSWEHPGAYNANGTPEGEPVLPGPGEESNWKEAVSQAPPVTGCNQLHFAASMSAQPDTSAGDSPTGLSFELSVPQTETPETLATPPLRDATVVMPAGMTVNPSSANGLEACSEAQIGWLGPNGPRGEALANKGLTNFTPAAPSCPEASKIGSVEVASPLLEKPVVGSVFLARQDENPFASLLAGYIVIDDPATGTIVKVPGELKTNPETGQITGVFDEQPQIPFSDFKLRFFGGATGELATPQSCGTFTTTADLMPWSAPDSGPDATPSSSFAISSNCALGLAPSFSAGTVSNQAGAFSPLTLTIARQDGEQHLTGLTVTTPPGLLGSLKGIPLCPEAQANAGTCSEESKIGETTVSSGVGPDPYVVHGGRVYLTGPYNGGPFGLSVVVPAIAGPFNLGDVVVRNSIRINPVTSQISVVSDPLPQMINSVEGLKSGIPADIRAVNVTINRPNFMFNATSCEHMSLSATISGAQGALVPVSSNYQAANCSTLPFKPQFTASTDGHTSKLDGASLHVKIASAGIGQANIAKVDLTIPNILPSRLTTLQEACTEAQFNTNPAGCPSASNIATAIVHTPLLNSPLLGPVYFVSHGGAAFPDTEIILQGEGVKLILDGHTQIKNGITYSRFESVPDAPFTSFEFNAPEGPFSIFTANANLCDVTVHMPTKIVAQSGTVLEQETLVTPEGCPNTITILSHTLNKRTRTLTLKAVAPSAGRLTATGKGIKTTTSTSNARGTLTLTIHPTKNGNFKTKIKLSFTPTKGTHLTTTLPIHL